jgi:GNAT superfamily N-acetyltransferase
VKAPDAELGSAGRPAVTVRAARLDDARAIAPLLATLGYPASEAAVRERLPRLLDRDDAGVLVAELDGAVIGLAAHQLVDLLYREQPQCRITALVVDPAYRRRGTASALVLAVDAHAREHGCFRLELTTRTDREDAHRFYTSLGFAARSHRLVRPMRD